MSTTKEGWIFILERSGLGYVLEEKLYQPLADEFPGMQIVPTSVNYDLLDIDRTTLIEESTLQNGLANYVISQGRAAHTLAVTHVNSSESLAAVKQLHTLGVLMTVRLPNPDVTVPEVSIGESTEFFENAGIPYFLDGAYATWVIENVLQLLRKS